MDQACINIETQKIKIQIETAESSLIQLHTWHALSNFNTRCV